MHIAAPLYDLISGDNKDNKSEPVELSPEALEAFNILKEKCVNAPVLSFPDFKKPFLLETDMPPRKAWELFSLRNKMMVDIIRWLMLAEP